MNTNVDVLAVLDALEVQTRQRGGSPSCQEISEARAAVAELIEVYEELLNELREISDEVGQEPYNNPRANAALARVKGA